MDKAAVDICAGAGGASLGITRAGWEVRQAVELDDAAWEAHEAGLPGAHRIADLRQAVGRLSGTLWWASLPCQPFSTAGKRQGAADDRNLFPVFVDVLETAQAQDRLPSWVIMENVKGLTHHRAKAKCGRGEAPFLSDACPACYLHNVMIPKLETFFDHVEYRILNAADYGVPQTRNRLIIQASNAGPIRWPDATHSEHALVLAKDVLGLPLSRRERATRKKFSTEADKLDLKPWVTVRQALGALHVRHQSPSAGTVQRHNEPGPTVGTKGVLYAEAERAEDSFNPAYHKVVGGGQNPRKPGDKRSYRDLTDGPSTTIAAQFGGGAGNAGPFVLDHGQKGTSRSVDEPSCTLRDSHGSGPRLQAVDWPDDAKLVMRRGRQGPGKGTTDEGRSVDSPSVAIVGGAGGSSRPLLQAASEPERLDRPSTTVMTTEVKGTRGEHMRAKLSSGGRSGGPDRASDTLYLATGRRRLTVAECAVLQGFPVDYPFQGTKTDQYKQVGNAVPPPLAEALASSPPEGLT